MTILNWSPPFKCIIMKRATAKHDFYKKEVCTMEISRLSRQKKNKERLTIYIKKDGQEQFGFGVHDDIFIRYALTKGMTLSDEEITEIQKDDAIYSYYTLAINYLSY